MAKVIKKESIDGLLGKLADWDIYGPVEEDGITSFRKISGGALPDFGNSRKPPKEVFFPQTEKMFDLKVEKHRPVGAEEPPMPDSPILLLGIRPCDMRAVNVLDKLFTWDYTDPYYMNKRERATIISFGCTLPRETCFCTSVGGSPSSTEGADMLWTDLGDSYFVEAFTDKGNRIIELGGDAFSEASGDQASAAENAKRKAEEAITRKLDIDGVAEALEAAFDHEYWDEFSAGCLGCGICTMLCPTCHCFDINDVLAGDRARRERTWDTCQFTYYTVHASSHNPRPVKKNRQRNRIYHKFLYSDKNLGMLGCVGCGRCISGCPVNIDIIEVVEGVKGVAKNG